MSDAPQLKRRRVPTNPTPDGASFQALAQNPAGDISTPPQSSAPKDVTIATPPSPSTSPGPGGQSSSPSDPGAAPAAPLKRKKKIIPSTQIEPDAVPEPENTNKAAHLSITTEIPDIDFDNIDSINNSAEKAISDQKRITKRSGDDFLSVLNGEGDDSDDLEDDFVDLSKMTKTEMSKAMNTAHRPEERQRFQRKMEAQQKEFLDKFKGIKAGGGSAERGFQQAELKRVLEETRALNLSSGKKYDPKTTNFDFSSVQIAPVSDFLGKRGFDRSFGLSAKDGVEFISAGPREFRPNLAKRILGLKNYEIKEEPSAVLPTDTFEQLNKLYNSLKGDNPKIQNLNYTSKIDQDLVSTFGLLLFQGSRINGVHLISELGDEIASTQTGTRKLVQVQTELIHAAAAADSADVKSTGYHYCCFICSELLKVGVLSDLFRGLARMPDWKRKHYFNDSPILSFDLCCRVGTIAEDVQLAEVTNVFPNKRINDFTPPLSAKDWYLRLQGLSRDYFSTCRNLLMAGKEDKDPFVQPLLVVIEQLLICMLSKTNGEIGKIDSLWALFCNAAQNEALAQIPDFAKFQSILKNAKGVTSSSKVYSVISEFFNQRLLHYIILYAKGGVQTTRGFENAGVLACEADCLYVASSLVILKDPNFSLNPEEVKFKTLGK